MREDTPSGGENAKRRQSSRGDICFSAAKSRVFKLLQQFETLQQVAAPYISFTPVDGNTKLQWRVGETYRFKTKLVGFLPFGEHVIRVVSFDHDSIYTNEHNTYVAVWNHEIVLTELANGHTEYTDRVEIYAGWKTFFVYTWAKLFYAHRQRKWVKILGAEDS